MATSPTGDVALPPAPPLPGGLPLPRPLPRFGGICLSIYVCRAGQSLTDRLTSAPLTLLS